MAKKKKEEKEERKINIDVSDAVEKATSDLDLGITQEYTGNRNIWDSKAAKENFKKDCYTDSATGKEVKLYKDPISKRELHKDHSAAKRKYKSKKYAQNVSESDHVIALERAHEINKANPFLSDEDLKRIYNKKENFEILSKSLNASKGEKSNLRFVLDDLKKPIEQRQLDAHARNELIGEQVRSTFYTSSDVAFTTLKNANEVGMESAKAGAAVGGTIAAGKHITAIINGDESVDKAVIEFGMDTIKSAASSYANGVATRCVVGTTEYVAGKVSSTKLAESLSKFAKSDGPAKVVVCAVEAGDTIIKYIKGELTPEETILQLGEKGTAVACSFAGGAAGLVGGATAGMLVGMVIGGVIGSIAPGAGTVAGAAIGSEIGLKIGAVVGEIFGNYAGYVLGSEMFRRVKEYALNSSMSHEEAIRMEAIYSELAKQIDAYTIRLAELIHQTNMEHEQLIVDAFCDFREGIICEDVQLVTDSLGKICKEYGVEVRFKDRKEFDEFMMS